MSNRTALVIAPHADDEVLGVGGTMARLASVDWRVVVLVVTRPTEPRFSDEFAAAVRAEAHRAHAILGVAETHFLDGFPAAGLDGQLEANLNDALTEFVGGVQPSWVFVPHPGDLHIDHQAVFRASLVATRPTAPDFPRRVVAYETVSETNWNASSIVPGFMPNVFVDITDNLDGKLAAMECFASQLRAAPHERSLETLRALAKFRGATVHLAAAEAFALVRDVVSIP